MKKITLFIATIFVAFNTSAAEMVVNENGATLENGITIGTSEVETQGTIQFDGINFKGFNGTSWINLDAKEAELPAVIDMHKFFPSEGYNETVTFNVKNHFGTETKTVDVKVENGVLSYTNPADSFSDRSFIIQDNTILISKVGPESTFNYVLYGENKNEKIFEVESTGSINDQAAIVVVPTYSPMLNSKFAKGNEACILVTYGKEWFFGEGGTTPVFVYCEGRGMVMRDAYEGTYLAE